MVAGVDHQMVNVPGNHGLYQARVEDDQIIFQVLDGGFSTTHHWRWELGDVGSQTTKTNTYLRYFVQCYQRMGCPESLGLCSFPSVFCVCATTHASAQVNCLHSHRSARQQHELQRTTKHTPIVHLKAS